MVRDIKINCFATSYVGWPVLQYNTDSFSVKSRRIRNRWLVAYTLLHNPSVRPLRASGLPAHDDQQDQGKEQEAEEETLNQYEVV